MKNPNGQPSGPITERLAQIDLTNDHAEALYADRVGVKLAKQVQRMLKKGDLVAPLSIFSPATIYINDFASPTMALNAELRNRDVDARARLVPKFQHTADLGGFQKNFIEVTEVEGNEIKIPTVPGWLNISEDGRIEQ